MTEKQTSIYHSDDKLCSKIMLKIMGEQNEAFSLGWERERVRKGFLERVAKLWRINGDYQGRWLTGEEGIENWAVAAEVNIHLLNKYLLSARHVLISSDLEAKKKNSISNISK